MQFIFSELKKTPDKRTKQNTTAVCFTFKLQVIFLLKLVAVNTFYILSDVW